MSKKEETPSHRGRFQAQGGGLEESEAWAQSQPLVLSKALNLLAKLKTKLSPKDYEKRKKPFEDAERFVNNASQNGGVFARISKTFKVKGSKDERVDIEVLSGKAFVNGEDE